MNNDDTHARQVKGLALVYGLAWLVILIPLVIGAVSAPGEYGEEALLWSLACGIAALGGLYGTWRLRRWGPFVYGAASLALLLKPLVLRGDPAGSVPTWGYIVLLVIFGLIVWANWALFRSRAA